MEKEYIWNNLHYALDDLPKFSIISVFPELPYIYTPKELDLYKINVQECTHDRSTGVGWNNRGNLGNKEVYYNIRCRTREELFEVHNFLLGQGFNRIQVFYDLDSENQNHVLKNSLVRRYYFDIENIQKHLTGFPNYMEYVFSEENLGDGVLMVPDPSGYSELYGTLQIRLCTRDIEYFINSIKELHGLGYKNTWLYPGREIQNWLEYNDKILIG